MSGLNWLEILGWNEEYLDSLRSTAFLYIRQGQYDTAKDYFHTLTIFNPDNSFDLQTLGSIYLQENNAPLAMEYLEKARSIDPNNQTIQMNYIKALLMLGYKEEALTLIRQFKQICKDPFMVSDAEALEMAYA